MNDQDLNTEPNTEPCNNNLLQPKAEYVEPAKAERPRQWRHQEAMDALTDDPDKHWPEIYKAMQEGRIDKKERA